VQDILNSPNQLMTASEFIEKTVYLLLMNYNAFIIPTYYTWVDEKSGQERRYYDSLFPINPTQVDFIEDSGGRLFVKFFFWNGESTTIPYDDVIHIKYNYSLSDYMGGDRTGQPDHKALLDTLNLNKTMLNGIAKAMNSSYQVNAVVKYNTMLDDGTMEKNVRELERKLQAGESGFLPMDLKGEFIPFPKDIKMVDGDTLKFIDEKILRNWGIPLAILTGDYTKEQYEAFYQKTLEPLITSLSQAFTKKLFTIRERAFGNQIKFYPKDLIFMTITQKIELANLLSPTGALFENEKRTMFGLMPLPELEGKRYMSLNWVEADMAAQYQMGKVGNVQMDVVDENKDETITEEGGEV
jgi:HK97 family phage portal protein